MRIYLHFVGTTSVPLPIMEEVLQELAKHILERERGTLKLLRQRFPEISKASLDEVLQQLDHGLDSNSLFRVTAVKKGSVGIYIALTALAYWLLDKTLAKTLEEAWVQTELHRKIRDYFLKGRKDQALALQRDINSGSQKLRARDARSNQNIYVPMHAEIDDEFTQISVRIDYVHLRRTVKEIPTYEDLESSLPSEDA